MSLSSLFKITLNCTFHKGRKWAESGSSTYIDLNNQKGISSFFGLCSPWVIGRKGPGRAPLLFLCQRVTNVKGTHKTLHLHVVHTSNWTKCPRP